MQAIALPREEHDAMVDTLHAIEPHLATELASLITAHREAGTFLEQPARISIIEPLPPAPSSIGPYRILRLLSTGGMGEVYEAEVSETVPPRRVAIKVIRRELTSPEVIRRFGVERHSLSRLDHPNIAHLLDGGTTEDGAPYLAMEFVEGERIDEFCEHQRCSIDQRLRVFLRVCEAVQYAHGQLIVHRDLKPDNILVTPDGTPTLLDFGIAKLLDPVHAASLPGQTRPGVNLFTPEYASPEQTEGREVTTASDVFSLGVLLYVLLTGHRPFTGESTSSPVGSPRVAWEPPEPSRREIHIATPEGVRRARRRLRGDIDTIILKALERDPRRRYFSVEQFAEDLRRHLNHLPIQARPAPAMRRVSKFLRRNRVLVGTVTVVTLGLVVGLIVAVHQMREAQKEKARNENVNTFLTDMLGYSNPLRPLSGSPRTATIMEDALDDAARRLESEEFSDQPELRIQLERILGDAFGHQGRYDLMYQHYRKYIQLSSEHPGITGVEMLDTQALWAMELFAQGRLPESEDLFRRTLPAMRLAAARGDIKRDLFAGALNNFGCLRRTQGDSKEAEASFREVLSMGPVFNPDTYVIASVTRATLASVLADQGRFQEALATAREAVEESHREGIDSTAEAGFVMTIYGGFLTEAGRTAEADTLLSDARKILFRLLAPSNLWTADNTRNEAALFYRQHDYAKALAFADEALRVYEKNFGTHYDTYPIALSIKGLTLHKLGRAAEAEKELRQAVRLRTTSLPHGHFFTALATGALGEFLSDHRRFSEAESLLVPSYRDLVTSQGPENPRTILARSRLYDMYMAWNRPREAAAYGVTSAGSFPL